MLFDYIFLALKLKFKLTNMLQTESVDERCLFLVVE